MKLTMAVAAIAVLGSSAEAGQLKSWQQSTLELLGEEPKVVEAIWPNGMDGSLWVSMRDDGSNRDGFADYICLLLGDAGTPEGTRVIIHIRDATSMAREEMKEIGSSQCKR